MGKHVLVSEGTLMDEDGNVIAPGLSAQQTIALWASPKTSVGAWAADFSTLAPFSLSDGVADSAISYDFICAAGTYSLDFIHLVGPNRGIYTITIDDVSVGTVDGYAVDFITSSDAHLGEPSMSTITGITLGAGAHVLKFSMGTKNAASSAYYGTVSAAVFTRTS